MATSATSGKLISIAASTSFRPRTSAAARTRNRPRRLTPQAGKAIEILAHAIEYLADEFALECMLAPATDTHARIAAIELLKARNREIYLSCPEIPTLTQRLCSLFAAKPPDSPSSKASSQSPFRYGCYPDPAWSLSSVKLRRSLESLF